MINIDYALDENGELLDEYFFHWEDFKEEGINYYYFVGLRSAGKTFDLFKSMIKYKKCLLIRRTDPELEIMTDEAHNPFIPLIHHDVVKSGYMKRKGKKIYKIYAGNEGKEEYIGDGVALNTFATTRSADYSYFERIYWDEFIKQPDQKEMKAEGSAWLAMIQTVARNRNIEVVACANSNDIYNPVFKELGVINKLERLMNDGKEGHKVYTDKERKLKIVLYSPTPELMEYLRRTSLHALTKGTRYADMAYKNEFIGNDFTDCEYKSIKGYRPMFIIDDYCVWKKKGENLIYLSYALPEGIKQYFSKYELDQENLRTDWYTYFRNRYLKHRITFEAYAIKRSFLDIMHLM